MLGLRREIALSLYRWATRAERARLVRSFEHDCAFPACILFYHRVANHTMNDWSIPVRNFQNQMDWILNNAAPASLDEIRQSQLQGHRTKPMVGVTFDDGYSENCKFAIPLLLERKIPMTYFVSTHFVESGEPYPHDVAQGKALRPNSIAEVKRMAAAGVVIGSHSHSHVDFGQRLSRKQLQTEIADARKKLQDWTGQSVDYFAFPFGLKTNMTQSSIDAVFEAGHTCFVSAAGGFNLPDGHADHLQRIHGDPGFAAFQNWLTFDPRKVFRPSPIHFERRKPNARRLGLNDLTMQQPNQVVVNESIGSAN